MNKKGTVGVGVIFGMMIGVMVWIAFTQLIGITTDFTQDARASTTSYGQSGLDCDNESISIGTKATCVVTDFMPFGWALAVFVSIFGTVGGVIGHVVQKQN